MNIIIHNNNFDSEERVRVNVDLTFSYRGEKSDGYSRKTKVARNLRLPRWIEGIINKGERYAVLLTKCDLVDGRYILRGREICLDKTMKTIGKCNNLYFINSNGEEELCFTFLPKEDNMRACLNASKHINREKITKEITLSYKGYTITSYHKEVVKDEVISCPQYVKQYFEIKDEIKEIILDSKEETIYKIYEGSFDSLYSIKGIKKTEKVDSRRIEFDESTKLFYISSDVHDINYAIREDRTKIASAISIEKGIRFVHVQEGDREVRCISGDGFRRGRIMKIHVEDHYELKRVRVVYYDNGATMDINELATIGRSTLL